MVKEDFSTFGLSHTLDKIVLLQEDLSKSALSTWIILQVEFVKSVKCTFISMNIQ